MSGSLTYYTGDRMMQRSPSRLAVHQQRKTVLCNSRSADAVTDRHRQQHHQDVVYRGQIVRVQVPQYYYTVCDDDFRYLFERLAAGQNNSGTTCKKSPTPPVHPVCAAAGATGTRSGPRPPVCKRPHYTPLPLTVVVDGSSIDSARQRSPLSSLLLTSRSKQHSGWSPRSAELSRCRSEPDLLVDRSSGNKFSAVSDAETSYWSCWTPPDEEQSRAAAAGHAYSPSSSAVQAGSSRTVVLKKKRGTFGFVLCGAKSRYEEASGTTFTPTAMFPALQYLDFVEAGSIAEKAGLVAGDYLLEINGQNVTSASHHQTVQLIKQAGDAVYLKVVTPTPDHAVISGAQTSEDAIPTRTGRHDAGSRTGDTQPPQQPNDRSLGDTDASPDLRTAWPSISERLFQTGAENKPASIISSRRDEISSLRQALQPPRISVDMHVVDRSGTNPPVQTADDGGDQSATTAKSSPRRSLPNIVIPSPPPPPLLPLIRSGQKNSKSLITLFDHKPKVQTPPDSARTAQSSLGMNNNIAAANPTLYAMVQRHTPNKQPTVTDDSPISTLKANGDAELAQINGNSSTITVGHHKDDEQSQQKPRRRNAPDPPKPPPLPPPPPARRVSLPLTAERLAVTPLISKNDEKTEAMRSFDQTLSKVQLSSVERQKQQTPFAQPTSLPNLARVLSGEPATQPFSTSSVRNNGDRIEEKKQPASDTNGTKQTAESIRDDPHHIKAEITSSGDERVQHKRRKAPSPPKIASLFSKQLDSSARMSSVQAHMSDVERNGLTSNDGKHCETPTLGTARLHHQTTTTSSSPLTTKSLLRATPDAPSTRIIQAPISEATAADNVRTATDAVIGRNSEAKTSSSGGAGGEFLNFIKMAERARQDYVRRKATAAMIAIAANNEMKRVSATVEPTSAATLQLEIDSTAPPAPNKLLPPQPDMACAPEMGPVPLDAKRPNTKITRSKVVERGRRPSSSASSVTMVSASSTTLRLSPPPGFDDCSI